MTQDEFSKIVTLFGVLGSILIIFNSININGLLSIVVNIIIGILGLISLFALLLDMESNASCKEALRERSQEIEDALTNNDKTLLKIWRCVIPERDMFREEECIKAKKEKNREEGDRKVEREVDWFIRASRIIIILWVILVLFIIHFGKQIQWANL